MTATVSVCMIVRNEAAILAHAIASTRGLADEVVVLDTGSTDGTVALAESLGAIVHTGGDRMHKAESRNRAAEAATGEWMVILDADEQIADPVGLRAFLMDTDAQAVYIKLAYMNGANQPTLSYAQMRCWRAGTFQYKYRAHEVPTPVNGWGKSAYTNFVWEHRPPQDRLWKSDYTRDRLLLDMEENPGDGRPLYYYGRQQMYRGDWLDSIDTLDRYLATSAKHDRADALWCQSKCYKQLGDTEKQILCLYLACAAQPARREWWGTLGQIYHGQGKYALAVIALKAALEIPLPAVAYATRYWYGSVIPDLVARCLWKLGRYEEGRKYALQAVELSPGDKRLSDNLGWFQRKLTPPAAIEEPVRIFVTGCAKSGTTLLKRLFHAFEDVEVLPSEHHISRFHCMQSSKPILVGKRHRHSVFSEHLSGAALDNQVALIKQHGVKIVNIIRDGRDVIFSDDKNVAPRRWVDAMEQRRAPMTDGLIVAEVTYENLVSRPDEIQTIIAKKLGLTVKHLWSGYPDFVPDDEFNVAGVLYEQRPIDAASTRKGLPYKELIADIAASFDRELAQAGYPTNEAEEMDAFYRLHGPDIHGGCARHQAIADLVEGPRVLDVGCGTGDLLLLLQTAHPEWKLTGTDISQVALEMARERGFVGNLVLMDTLPPPGMAGWDTVIMSQVLEHVEDAPAMIKAARAALRDGGKLIVSVPNGDAIPSRHHLRDYTEESLTALLEPIGKPELLQWSGQNYRLLAQVVK